MALRSVGARDFAFEIESSVDLRTWEVLGEENVVRRSMLPDGRERLVVAAPESSGNAAAHFFRVKTGGQE